MFQDYPSSFYDRKFKECYNNDLENSLTIVGTPNPTPSHHNYILQTGLSWRSRWSYIYLFQRLKKICIWFTCNEKSLKEKKPSEFRSRSQRARRVDLLHWPIPQIRNKYIKESNHNGPKIECNKNWGKFTDQRLKIRDTQKI